jgi:hypothetical protein
MSKKWITVIPCGFEVIHTIKIAQKKGYKVVGIDQNPAAPGFSHCDFKISSSIDDYETILHQLKSNNIIPECFVPVVSDKAVFPSYILNLHFGKAIPNLGIMAFYSKSILRGAISGDGFVNPKYLSVDKSEDKEAAYQLCDSETKLIIKPDDSSGSRGITIIDNASKSSIDTALNHAFEFSSIGKVIAEQYVPGEEFMVDCFVFKGEVKSILISAKIKVQDKVSYHIHSVNRDLFDYDTLIKKVQHLSSELQYLSGPMHLELKIVDDNQYYLLDLAARGGGFGVFNYYTQKCTGFDFAEATLDVFLYKELSHYENQSQEGLMYFVIPSQDGILKDVTCDYEFCSTEDVKIDFYFEKNQKVTTDPTDGNRLAAIYCFAKETESLNALLNKVLESIKQVY